MEELPEVSGAVEFGGFEELFGQRFEVLAQQERAERGAEPGQDDPQSVLRPPRASMVMKFGNMDTSGGTMSATRMPRKIRFAPGTRMNTSA